MLLFLTSSIFDSPRLRVVTFGPIDIQKGSKITKDIVDYKRSIYNSRKSAKGRR